MKARMDRRTVAVAMGLILAALVLLRVFNIGHSLTYDEAWNANSVVAAASGNASDVFYPNFLRHPPLYSGLAALFAVVTGADRFAVATAMRMMSLVFAAGVAVALFLCGRDWFDDRVGLAAAFLFAVMPAARAYDSIAKPESLTLLLGLLFLLFFFRDKVFLSGVFLGLAMLTKEIFIFLPAGLLLFLLLTRRFGRLKALAAAAGTGIALSFWWYLFVTNSKGEFLRFFLGTSQESANWQEPLRFYLGRLPADLGWPVLALCALGIAFLVAHIAREGWPGGSGAPGTARQERGGKGAGEAAGAAPGERPSWEMAILPVTWVVFTYAFLSLSHGKPPWLIYSALPAFALLGGWSLLEAARALPGGKWAARALVTAALVSALALSVPVGFGSFMMKADRTYRLSVSYRQVAEYINSRTADRGTILMPIRDFSPNLAFYLKSYEPGSVHLLPGRPGDAENPPPYGQVFLLYQSDTDAAGIAEHARLTSPSFVVTRPGFRSADGADPAVLLSRVTRPVDIGGVWVFDAGDIERAQGGENP